MLLEIESKVYTLVRMWNSMERLSSLSHDLKKKKKKKSFKHYISPEPRAFQGSTKCFRMKN